MAATLSSDEMKGIIEDANLRTVREMADEDGIVPVMMPETDEDGNPIPDDRPQRNVLVVACGDGGCNIGTAIVCAVPDDAYVIAVNSSDRNLKTETLAHCKIYLDQMNPEEEEASRVRVDGTGKDRSISKDLFRNKYRLLIEAINEAVNVRGNFDYAMVINTTDGGTGSGMGPMAAKLIHDNISDLGVIVVGVYPDVQNDAQSMFNALDWQKEVVKIGLPYFILDNSLPIPPANLTPNSTVRWVHNEVNRCAADLVAIIAGRDYDNTTISIIDNANLRKLVEIGDRMVAVTSKARPTAGQTLDSYLDNILAKCCQPLPAKIKGIGLWVKAPADILQQLDVHLSEFQLKYGQAQLKFNHIQESSDGSIAVSILLSGCNEATDQLSAIRHRYDDIMADEKDNRSRIDDLVTGLVNPTGSVAIRRARSPEASKDKIDASALEI